MIKSCIASNSGDDAPIIFLKLINNAVGKLSMLALYIYMHVKISTITQYVIKIFSKLSP